LTLPYSFSGDDLEKARQKAQKLSPEFIKIMDGEFASSASTANTYPLGKILIDSKTVMLLVADVLGTYKEGYDTQIHLSARCYNLKKGTMVGVLQNMVASTGGDAETFTFMYAFKATLESKKLSIVQEEKGAETKTITYLLSSKGMSYQ
jgi:ketopantoate hydroxymethyltransferase